MSWWLPPPVDPKIIDFKNHLSSLAMSENAYYKWCEDHGFSTEWDKSEHKRFQELKVRKEEKIQKAFKEGKIRSQPLSKRIRNYLKDKQSEDKDIAEYRQMAKLNNFPEKDFLLFLEFVDKNTDVLAIRNIKTALLEIFKHNKNWVRDYSKFHSKSKNINVQFEEIVQHLFSLHPISPVLYQVWLYPLQPDRDKFIPWFLWIVSGKNFKGYTNVSFSLNKAMVHHFLNAPSNYSLIQAVRYGQLKFLKASPRLINAILDSVLGRTLYSKEQEEFWLSFFHFICRQQFFDTELVSSLVDYLVFQKFSPEAPQRNMSLKGRNLENLFDESEAWHRRIQKEQGKGFLSWDAQSVESFSKEEKRGDEKDLWTVEELVNSKKLEEEGRAMSHCVASYKYACHQKRTAIWSIKLNGIRMATLEVNLNNQSIVQAKGKRNASVEGKTLQIMYEFAGKVGYDVSIRSYF